MRLHHRVHMLTYNCQIVPQQRQHAHDPASSSSHAPLSPWPLPHQHPSPAPSLCTPLHAVGAEWNTRCLRLSRAIATPVDRLDIALNVRVLTARKHGPQHDGQIYLSNACSQQGMRTCSGALKLIIWASDSAAASPLPAGPFAAQSARPRGAAASRAPPPAACASPSAPAVR